MRNAWSNIKNWVGRFFSAGAELISAVAHGVASAAWKVVSAVGKAVSNAWSHVKSFVAGHSGGQGGMGGGMGAGPAISQARTIATKVGRAYNTQLQSSLTDGMGGRLNSDVNAHMSRDVRHSMQENNKPIVNVTVRNESDISAIKSYIEDSNSKDASFDLY